MVMQGKRIVYSVAFVLNIAAFILLLIACASPYWVQSWPRVHSGFKRIGMWEACFAGLILERDPSQKAYHGCWWILAPEFMKIRDWVMPWWFVFTQVLTTVIWVMEGINLIIMLYVWTSTDEKGTSGRKKRAPVGMTMAVTLMTVIAALTMVFVVIMFGTAVYIDRKWMPRPDLNYLSWSYGLAVVSAFFSIFASMALVVFNNIIRNEYRSPGTAMPVMGGLPVKDSAL